MFIYACKAILNKEEGDLILAIRHHYRLPRVELYRLMQFQYDKFGAMRGFVFSSGICVRSRRTYSAAII